MPSLDPIVRISTDVTGGRFEEFNEFLQNRLVSFEFTDKARGADEVKLVFNNNDLALLDNEMLAPGSIIGVLFGYTHVTHEPVTFTIRTIEGLTQYSVKGPASGSAVFIGRQRTRSFEDSTEWEVAEEIATALGYVTDESKDIDKGDYEEIRRGITQAGETDMAFLQRIAQRVDCVFFLREGVFHFHPPRLGNAPIKTIRYGDGGHFVDEPKIEYSTQGRGARSTRSGVSSRDRTTVTGTAGNTNDPRRDGLGSYAALPDPGSWEDQLELSATERLQIEIDVPTQESIMPTIAESNEEAEQDAQRTFRMSEREAIKIEGTVIGDPEIVADETIIVEGLGERYSGTYHIFEAVHKRDSGYTTKLILNRNALSSSLSATPATQDWTSIQDAEINTAVVNEQRSRSVIGGGEWNFWPDLENPVTE